MLKDNVPDKSQADGEVIVVNNWLARTTLDVIGESPSRYLKLELKLTMAFLAAFHFQFGALDNSQNEVSKAYHNMFADSTLYPTTWSMLLRATWRWMPVSWSNLAGYLPTREYRRFRQTLNVINDVSRKLVDEKTEEAKQVEVGKGSKDVMSVLGTSQLSTLTILVH